MKLRKIIVVHLGLGLALLAASLSFGKDLSHKEIGNLIVGAVFPKTGPQMAYGEEALVGLSLALEELTRRDPELASHIKLIEGDDASTPNGARLAAEDLMKQRASILIGSVTNNSTLALALTAEKHKRPLVVPASPGLSLTGDYSFIFRSCAVDKWQGHLLARFAVDSLGKKKAALLVNPLDPYSHDIAELFKSSLTARGGQVVANETYAAAQRDFSTHLQNIVAAQAEVILFPTSSYQEAAEVMAAMKKAGLSLPLLGVDRWHTPRLAQKAGSAYAGHFYPLAFAIPEENPAVQIFVEAFKKRLHRYPSPLAAMTYDAFLVVAEAFKRAGTIRPQELARALGRTEDAAGLLGAISINAEHSAEKSGVMMKTTLQGSRVYSVVPADQSSKQRG